MANKKITDATQISTMSGSDKLFVNSGDDLKQITLDQAVAASTPVQQLNSNLSAIIPDYTKATKIFECVDYDTTRKNYIAPSDGYLNYQVFKGAIMINYAGILRFGSIVDDDGYATGGLVPIKKGTTVNIAGARNTGDSSAISEVWFIPI